LIGQQLAAGDLEPLAPAVPEGWPEVQHLSAIADPASLGESGGRFLSPTCMACLGHHRCPAPLAGHVVVPTLAAVGEVLAVRDQALVQLAEEA
jgi:hypothetical protein